MNKDEILAKSRKENENQDEMEMQVFAKSGQKACAVGGFVCVAIIILQSIFKDKVDFSVWAVYLSMTGTMLLYKYIKLKKKHELIFGLIQLVLAAIFLGMFIYNLVG